jgi:hypothetical protein
MRLTVDASDRLQQKGGRDAVGPGLIRFRRARRFASHPTGPPKHPGVISLQIVIR